MGLTREQNGVVIAPVDRHIKVSSVAGSGKSTLLVARVKHLLSKKVHPSEILVVMFNKAARIEFSEKLKKVIKGEVPNVRTFHSFGNQLIQTFTSKGLLPEFSLETRSFIQQQLARSSLIETIDVQELDADINKTVIEEFISFIDRVKSETESPSDVWATLNKNPQFSFFIQAFDVFEKKRNEEKIRFFSDLIYDPVKVIMENDDVRKWIGNGRVKHILIDEYQDINSISQYLIKSVAGESAYVTCVGDADQTIYEFRGSKPEYIVNKFDDDFSNPLDHKLTRTFRYGHTLSLMANHVIVNNTQRDDKLCISAPSTFPTSIEVEQVGENNPITEIVKRWTDTGRKLNEIGILVRLFSMSVPIELKLLSSGIPYQIEGHDSVLQLRHINAIIGVLNLANNTLFNGDEYTVSKQIEDMLSVPHIGLKADVIKNLTSDIISKPEDASKTIIEASDGLEGFQIQNIAERASLWDEIKSMYSASPEQIIDHYIKATNLFDRLFKMAAFADEAEEQISAIEGFESYAKSTKLPLGAFLEHINELRNIDVNHNNKSDSLLITSTHRSKGLEWPLVILPDLREGKFPHIKKEKGRPNKLTKRSLESERRLFYVAATRAQDKLVLMTPRDEGLIKWINEKKTGYPSIIEGQEDCASRFVYEANIKLSSELGKLLHKKGDVAISLSASDPEVANSYLAELKVPSKVSKL